MREAWDPSEYAITPSSFEITRLTNNNNAKKNDDEEEEIINKNSGALSQKAWEKLRGEPPNACSREELDAPWHGFGTASPSLLREEGRGVDAGSKHNSDEEFGGGGGGGKEGGRLEALMKGTTTTTQARGDHPQEQQRNQQQNQQGEQHQQHSRDRRNEARENNTAAWFRGKCLALNCDEVCTAQGYLCKFHRVAKAVILERDETKEEVRWCHYCKKVQKLSEFTEASKTLCHAKYVLRCERSKRNREKIQKQRREKAAKNATTSTTATTTTTTTTHSDPNSLDVGSARSGGSHANKKANNNNNNVVVTSSALQYSEKPSNNRNSREVIPEEVMMSPENPFFANLLEENFLNPIYKGGNNDEFDWTSTIEVTNHRLRVDAHPSELLLDNEKSAATAAAPANLNPNKVIWNELSRAGLVSNDDNQIEYAQISPGSTILSWQSFRKIHATTKADFVNPDDTLKENDFARGKPVRDSSIFLRNFMSYSGFRLPGSAARGRGSTEQVIHAQKTRGNDGSIKVYKTQRSHMAWAEEAAAPLVAVVGRPFIVRLGEDFRANEITAVRAYGAFGTRKISSDAFSPSGVATFPADTFASISNFNSTGGGLFWIQFETADDRCSIPKPALILPDVQMAMDAHLALRCLRSEHAMRCAIQDIGSVLSFAESGYLYEDEMRDWLQSIIHQCEQSPPFQENAKSLIALLKKVENEINAHEKEMNPGACQRTRTTKTRNSLDGSCSERDHHLDSDVLVWGAFEPNTRDADIEDYFEEWFDDDMNEFRYGNRCAMMAYGVFLYFLCFLVHLFRLAPLFKIHPFWAFFSNASTFYIAYQCVYSSAGLKHYSKPRYFYLGVWWSFFWYGRVSSSLMKNEEISERVGTMLTVCLFIASTLGFWQLKPRDAIVGPTGALLLCYYDSLYASVHSVIMNKDKSAHVKALIVDYGVVLVASIFTTLYVQVAVKSLALRRCKAMVREARISRGKVKMI